MKATLVFPLLDRAPLSIHGRKRYKKIFAEKLEKKKALSHIKLEMSKIYQRKIKPLFKNSCFDCHESLSYHPWYYKVPGIRKIIDRDIKEAKKHIDLSEDHPFKSLYSKLNALESISKMIKTKAISPFFYALMHNNPKLSAPKNRLLKLGKSNL